uniref:Tubulin delta chain n=1 Tax=Trichobilharzia regenti TaxID=157069 RepID=A0AA85JF35_TRIRE|nr:unnamed protein product [Trichobilharzia regenti]
MDKSFKANPKTNQCCTKKIDISPGICLVHSLAGGTGSGFGLRLLEEAQDNLGVRLCLTFSVMPYCYGESPLQAYNILLSLAGLTRIADGIVLLYNDWLLAQVQLNSTSENKTKTTTRVLENVTGINNLAAEQMTNLLAPCSSMDSSESHEEDKNNDAYYLEPWAICQTLTPLCDVKFVRCISSDDRKHITQCNWVHMIEDLQFKLCHCPTHSTWSLNKTSTSAGCQPNNCISALLIYRMRKPSDLVSAQSLVPRKSNFVKNTKKPFPFPGNTLLQYLRPVGWNEEPLVQWFDCNYLKSHKSVTLAFNSCCITEDLNSLIYRARVRQKVGAYLHWYEKYGCTKDNFDEAFEQLKHVIEAYKNLI